MLLPPLPGVWVPPGVVVPEPVAPEVPGGGVPPVPPVLPLPVEPPGPLGPGPEPPVSPDPGERPGFPEAGGLPEPVTAPEPLPVDPGIPPDPGIFPPDILPPAPGILAVDMGVLVMAPGVDMVLVAMADAVDIAEPEPGVIAVAGMGRESPKRRPITRVGSAALTLPTGTDAATATLLPVAAAVDGRGVADAWVGDAGTAACAAAGDDAKACPTNHPPPNRPISRPAYPAGAR